MATTEGLQEWQHALGQFLTEFAWDLYATPSFRFPVTHSQAQRDIHKWVSGFGPGAFGYVTYEEGFAGGRSHTHVLLGGLNLMAQKHAGRLWKSGLVTVDRFDPSRGACWYVAKFPAAGEFLGTPRRRTQMARANLYGRS